jgi:isoaspartyl peptidase/L-asparaginase-like protein (Ntn-hydrolase superfamily)
MPGAILQKNGRALDAVEAGVMVAENDFVFLLRLD